MSQPQSRLDTPTKMNPKAQPFSPVNKGMRPDAPEFKPSTPDANRNRSLSASAPSFVPSRSPAPVTPNFSSTRPLDQSFSPMSPLPQQQSYSIQMASPGQGMAISSYVPTPKGPCVESRPRVPVEITKPPESKIAVERVKSANDSEPACIQATGIVHLAEHTNPDLVSETKPTTVVPITTSPSSPQPSAPQHPPHTPCSPLSQPNFAPSTPTPLPSNHQLEEGNEGKQLNGLSTEEDTENSDTQDDEGDDEGDGEGEEGEHSRPPSETLNGSKRRQYKPEYMRSLRDLCFSKPDGLPNLSIVIGSTEVEDDRTKKTGSNKKDGKKDRRGGKTWRDEPRKTVVIDESLPFEPLKKSENAWKVSPPSDEDEKKLRTIRGVLNRLTPEKFDVLTKKITDLELNTKALLEGVIELVFDKAVMEPSFIGIYAKLCVEVSAKSTEFEGEDGSKLNFRTMLLNKCQSEFEAQSHREGFDELPAEEREQKERKLKLRMLGNMRFIGELYKREMLRDVVMVSCMRFLLDSSKGVDEEDIEALCKLLTTIGEVIERKGSLDFVFQRLEELQKDESISSRIQFMMLDLIDLRANRWKPRHAKNDPKTIKEIHNEVEKEKEKERIREEQRGRDDQRNRDDRGRNRRDRDRDWEGDRERGDRGDRGRDRGASRKDEERRLTRMDSGSASSQDVRSAPATPQKDGDWEVAGKQQRGRGAKDGRNGTRNTPVKGGQRKEEVRKQEPQPSPSKQAANMKGKQRAQKAFNTLAYEDLDNDGDEDDTESQSIDVSASSSPVPSRDSSRANSPVPFEMDDERQEQNLRTILEELFDQSSSFDSRSVPSLVSVPQSHYTNFVKYGVEMTLEKPNRVGRFTTMVLVHRTLLVEKHLCEGLDAIVQVYDDFAIDFPYADRLLPELLCDLVTKDLINLQFFKKLFKPLVDSGSASKLFGETLKRIRNTWDDATFSSKMIEVEFDYSTFLVKGKRKRGDVDQFIATYLQDGKR